MNDKIPDEQPPIRIDIERMVFCRMACKYYPATNCDKCQYLIERKRYYVICDFPKYWREYLEKEYGRKDLDGTGKGNTT